MKFTGEFFVPHEHSEGDFNNHELQIEHKHRYLSILKLAKDKVVLDIASGEGYGTNILSGSASKVYGVDISADLVAHASKTYTQKNISFQTGSVDAIPLPDQSVDMVVSFETLEHVTADIQKKFIAEAKRVLKPGGLMVISTPERRNYTERYNHHNEFHLHELYKEEFTGLLNEYFAHVHLYEQGFEITSLILNKDVYSKGAPLSCFKIDEKAFNFEGKYLIGVCSDDAKLAETSIAGIIPESERSYFSTIDRILELQNEVENLGAWGRKSNEEIEQLREKNRELQQHIEELGAWGRKSNSELEILKERNDQLQQQLEKLSSAEQDRVSQSQTLAEANQALQQMLNEKSERLEQLNQELSELEELRLSYRRSTEDQEKLEKNIQHSFKSNYSLKKELEKKSNQIYKIESEKKELEERLRDIYSSDGYRLLAVYYRLKAKYLPEGSPRQIRLKAFIGRLKSKKIFNRVKSKTPAPSVTVSATELAQKYNVIPEVPDDIQFPLALPVFEQPLVSIVIPAYNNWAFTRNCIISIYQHTGNVPYEIIVGDNVSTDETVNFEKYFTNVNYIRNPENLGYILNINNAASKARGKFVLTLNNDTTVTPNWLSSMIEVMERDPMVGLVGSKLVFPDGSLQEAGGIVWNDASGWNYGRGSDPNAPEYNYLKEVDYISGASNLVRKELWDRLKGLDERYVPAYFDDSDLAFNIRSLGYKVIYQPLSVVIHYEGLTHGTSTSSGTKKYQAINEQKFIDKWRKTLQNEQFPGGDKVFYARDRSRNKKTILVIDHYVPQFDKDAGSRTTYQYLDLFVDMGLNVKFLGDNFYRHEPYTTILQQKGIEVLYGSYYAENWQKWILDNEKYIDYIFLNRPHISIKYIDLVRNKMHGKVFYYGHDLHFVREQKEYEITKDEKLLESMLEWKKTEYSLFEKSDVVLVPTIKEKEVIAPDFPRKKTEVMPAFFYPSIAPPVTNFDQRRNLLFVGGFTHRPNQDAVIWFATKVFPIIRKKIPGIQINVVGSNMTPEILDLASSSVIIKGFVNDEELEKLYQTTKLSIIPLRYGAGLKGKTVESMSKGIPLVSTSFGLEGMEEIDNILQPFDNETDFANEVIRLYNDTKALEQQSEQIVNYSKKYFTKDSARIFFNKLFDMQ